MSEDASTPTPPDSTSMSPTWSAVPVPSDSTPPTPPERDTITARIKRALAPLGAAAAFLAKFGILLLKLKSVVFLGSAAVSVLAYAQLWGWQYAVGFVLLILLHELGHVVALRARGVRSSALVFIPLLGAFTSWKSAPRSAYEDAETALAGPIAGTVGSLAVGYLGHSHHSDLLLSLAFTGLVINLFNLIPALPLDGGRLTHLLHPVIWVVGVLALLAYELLHPGVLVLILLLLAAYQLYHQTRDRDGSFRRMVATLEPGQRAIISTAYLILVAVILLGMQATYVKRQLS